MLSGNTRLTSQSLYTFPSNVVISSAIRLGAIASRIHKAFIASETHQFDYSITHENSIRKHQKLTHRKRLRHFRGAPNLAPASWTAAVPCRFLCGGPTNSMTSSRLQPVTFLPFSALALHLTCARDAQKCSIDHR